MLFYGWKIVDSVFMALRVTWPRLLETETQVVVDLHDLSINIPFAADWWFNSTPKDFSAVTETFFERTEMRNIFDQKHKKRTTIRQTLSLRGYVGNSFATSVKNRALFILAPLARVRP